MTYSIGDIVKYKRVVDDVVEVDVTGYITNIGEYEVDPKTYYDIQWFNHIYTTYGRYTLEENPAMNETWEVVQ